MSAYPVAYEADYVEERSRLSNFFRLLLVIPHLFVGMVVGVAGMFTVPAAWFAVVFTGRYPQGLYDFNAGLLRWSTRLTAYLSLLTDRFPPWWIDEAPEYPVRVLIAPPKAQYSRAKALLRIFLMIPPYILVYVLSIVWQLAAIAAWFVTVVTGRQPRGLQGALNMYLLYNTPFMAYMFLMTEDWPPIALVNTDPAPRGQITAQDPATFIPPVA